jgi:heptosyltransferase-2
MPGSQVKQRLKNLWGIAVNWAAEPGVVRPLGWLWMAYHRRIPSAPRIPDLGSAREVVVVRYDGLGDLVVTTSFLRDLRAACPRARITAVVRDDWMDLLTASPHLDRVLGFALRIYPRYTPIRRVFDIARFCRQHFWPVRPDVVIIAQSHITQCEVRYFALFSGAPVRLGRTALAKPGEPGPSRDSGWKIMSHLHLDARTGHDAEQFQSWLKALGASVGPLELSASWDTAAAEEAARLLGPKPSTGLRVALGIGASKGPKTWPLERYIEVGRRLKQRGAQLVLIGASDLAEPASEFMSQEGTGVRNLVGPLRLQATAAALAQCELFIGNDSGPMHLAAAVGLPVVEIVGWPADVPPEIPGTPLRIGPVCKHRRIVQPAGNGRDWSVRVADVSVEAAWTAVESILDEVRGPAWRA